MSEPRALVVLIDNSAQGIDGDFYPSRLVAQKVATERLARHLFLLNPETRVAVGTISDREFGIRLSFTGDVKRLVTGLNGIGCGGTVNVVRGLRAAFLALEHGRGITGNKRVLLFIGSPNTVTPEEAQSLASEAASRSMGIDVVVFGTDLYNWKTLMMLNKGARGSEFLKVPVASTILSDVVLASRIGAGSQTHVFMRSKVTNAALVNAVKMTLMACLDDTEADKGQIQAQLEMLDKEIAKGTKKAKKAATKRKRG